MASDLRHRVTAYCEAMREGHLVHAVSIEGIQFRLGITPENFGHDIFVVGGELMEQREMGMLLALPIAARGLVLDIGANSGSYSIFLAKAFPHCSIVPFECVPVMAEAVRRNVALNGLENVDTRHLGIAVGDRPGRARLIADESHGAVGTQIVLDSAGSVPLATIDSLDLGPVVFAKIDVEGHEISVLKGMRRTLSRFRFPILIEVRHRALTEFLGFLCHWQYRVRAVIKGPARGGYCNVLIDRP